MCVSRGRPDRNRPAKRVPRGRVATPAPAARTGARFRLQLLHHGGRPGADAANEPDQEAGQPCPASDVTEVYAADWTREQLRDSAQRIADRIDDLIADGAAHTPNVPSVG